MPAAPRVLTGNLTDINAAAAAGVVITFERGGVASQYGDVVLPNPTSVVTNASGAFSVTLYPGTYSAFARTQSGPARFNFSLAEDGSTDLAALLEEVDIPVTAQIVLDTQAARDEAIAAVATVPLSQEDFSTVAALLADTALTYTTGQPKSVTVGQIVPAGGFRYEVAASTATDHHATTAGGVKLKVLPNADGSVTLNQFGATGDGVTNDTAAVLAANASGLGPFSLGGGVFETTIAPSSLSLVSYGGTIWTVNADGNREQYRPQSVFYDHQIKSRSTKARVTDWNGKKLLWLGTSIPQFGIGDGSYPELFASALGCSVTNNAFAGSRARWEGLGGIDPTGSTTQVRNLSMTAADVAAGLAMYGPGSVFDDNYDAITKASQMTCDARIGNVFAAGQVDVVFLDHNHNDRRAAWGAPSTVSSSISSVTFGATTEITVANGSLFAAGDGVGLTATGVARFAFAAGRVQSVVGNAVTIAYNTTALTGSVTGGVLYKLDRATIHGAWDFLIYFIKGQAAFYAYPQPQIILCSAPSEWTNNSLNNDIWANGEAIKRVADFWSLPFFDVSTEYRVTEKDHTAYFSDNVHPATRPERQALANLWVAWAEGGYPKRLNETDYLPASGSPFADQTIAVYSAVRGVFVAPTQIAGAYSTILSEDFSSGLGSYTSVGASPAPTVTTAPWDVNEDALYAVVSSTQADCYIHRNLSMTKANRLSFDFWLPEVVGLTTGTAKVITLLRTRTTNQHMALRLVIRAERTTLQVVYFAEPAAVFTQLPGATISLSADTKYRVSMEYITDDGNSTGGFRVLLDGVEIIAPTATVDSAHGAATRIDVGLFSSSLADDFDAYIGNLLVESRAVETPFSGTVASPASVTVINGIVTAVS